MNNTKMSAGYFLFLFRPPEFAHIHRTHGTVTRGEDLKKNFRKNTLKHVQHPLRHFVFVWGGLGGLKGNKVSYQVKPT